MSGTRAIFLDRDGTIIVDRGYLADPDGVAFLPNAVAGLRALAATGLPLVVLTNQSGVGRGMFSVRDVEAVNARIQHLLAGDGVDVAGWYFCPHHPDDGCGCRKPAAGMAVQAARDLNLSCAGSFVIGDRLSDMKLAREIEAGGIMVASDDFREEAAIASEMRIPLVADLLEACGFVKAALQEP